RVPKKFMDDCRPKLSRKATLRIPTGLTWKVMLRRNKEDKAVYFTGQGWVDFMNDNGIKYGYFLEFEYQGNNHFNVYIIDRSSTEIDYLTKLDHHANANQMTDDGDGDGDGDDDVDVDDGNEPIHDSDDQTMLENSPRFSVTVQKYSISSNSYLHIPKSFMKKYMKEKEYRYCKLQVDDGREWIVKCYYNRKSEAFRLTGSRWTRFVQENNWIQGQVYTFFLLSDFKSNGLMFKVI
ncbi:B3 domain-containing transcription factor VRN1, partial [Bienertia sinuspersici]